MIQAESEFVEQKGGLFYCAFHQYRFSRLSFIVYIVKQSRGKLKKPNNNRSNGLMLAIYITGIYEDYFISCY